MGFETDTSKKYNVFRPALAGGGNEISGVYSSNDEQNAHPKWLTVAAPPNIEAFQAGANSLVLSCPLLRPTTEVMQLASSDTVHPSFY